MDPSTGISPRLSTDKTSRVTDDQAGRQFITSSRSMFTKFNISCHTDSDSHAVDFDHRQRKRRQVARACDWCRLNRIKCDDGAPCENCHVKGRRCSNARSEDARSLPAANRKIELLKARVREFESRVEKPGIGHDIPGSAFVMQGPAAQGTVVDGLQGAHGDAWTPQRMTESHSIKALSSADFHRRLRSKLADCATTSSHHQDRNGSGNGDGDVIGVDGRQGQSKDHLLPLVDTLATATISATTAIDQIRARNSVIGPSYDSVHRCTTNVMSRQQEEYHLRLFWQSHHLQLPILDEKAFMQMYSVSWDHAIGRRTPNALVEIVLALCIQCSAPFTLAEVKQSPGLPHSDAETAGWWHYLQSENLLLPDRDSPQLATAQAAMLIVVYLLNASRPTAARIALTAAVEIARAWDLERFEPLSQSGCARHDLLYASLYILDTTINLDRGGPFIFRTDEIPGNFTAHLSTATPLLHVQNVTFADINMGDCHQHCAALAVIVRSMRSTLLEASTSREGGSLHCASPSEAKTVERSAVLLQEQSRDIQQWIRRIPDMLRLPRHGLGQSMSTQRSQLVVDSYIPLWLQRQRIVLELSFHHHMMLLYRSFVFPLESQSVSYPTSAEHGVSSLLHATAITNIIHQVIVGTDIVNTMHAVYNLQRDALLVLAAFAATHPICPHTKTAIHAMKTAAATLKLFAENNSLGSTTETASAALHLLDQVTAVANSYRHSFTPFLRDADALQTEAPTTIATSPSNLPVPHLPSHNSAPGSQPTDFPHDVSLNHVSPSISSFLPDQLPTQVTSSMNFEFNNQSDEHVELRAIESLQGPLQPLNGFFSDITWAEIAVDQA